MKTLSVPLLVGFVSLSLGSLVQAQSITVNTFDYAWADPIQVTTTPPVAEATFTASGTAGNYFILGVSTEDADAGPTGATFGGSAMTLLGTVANTSAGYAAIYGIATTGSSGSVVVSYGSDWITGGDGGTQPFAYGFLSNVDTASPVRSANTFADGGSSSETLSLGSVSAGDLGFFSVYRNSDTITSFDTADTAFNLTQTAITGSTSVSPDADPATFNAAFGYDVIASATGSYDVAVTGSGSNTRFVGSGVVLQAVPEPSTALLLVGAGAAMVMLRRRRS